MRKVWLIALLAATLPGCALFHAESDADALRFSSAWETPRLAQQAVSLRFSTEGRAGDWDRSRGDAAAELLDSGKFRLVEKPEDAAYSVEITVRVRRKTAIFKTAAGALMLYAWPVDVQSYFCEVFADIRRPSGELVAHCYAQGRGRSTMWLGYALWPEWLWNGKEEEAIRRDTLKAAVVKMCRALMPEE